MVFVDEIRSRTPRLSLAEDDGWTSRFEVDVADHGSHFTGALTVHAERASSERREVTAKSCEEVLETLALIVAVAIDPNASLRRLPQRAEEPKAEPEPPPPPVFAPPPSAPRPSAPASPNASADSKPRSPATWRPQLLLGGEARGAFADSASFAGSFGLEVERWGWAVRLSALQSMESTVMDPFGREARFRWTAGRLEGGPRWAMGAFSLQGALGLDVGRVTARAELEQGRWWVSALALGRARWEPLSPVGFEVVAGAFVPLTRDRYALFDPDTVLYRERALGGLVGLGLYFRL